MTATGVRGGGRAMAQAGPVRGARVPAAVLALAPGLAALFASRAWAQRRRGHPARIGWVSYIGRPDVGLDQAACRDSSSSVTPRARPSC